MRQNEDRTSLPESFISEQDLCNILSQNPYRVEARIRLVWILSIDICQNSEGIVALFYEGLLYTPKHFPERARDIIDCFNEFEDTYYIAKGMAFLFKEANKVFKKSRFQENLTKDEKIQMKAFFKSINRKFNTNKKCPKNLAAECPAGASIPPILLPPPLDP